MLNIKNHTRNLRFIRKLPIMLFLGGVLLSKAVVAADTPLIESYALPRSKSNIEICHRKVLLAHPGRIERQLFQLRNGNEYFLYGIQANDGSEWSIMCDSLTGKIINEQKLDTR